MSCFELNGKGTLRIPIARPDIVIDRSDRVYALYRGDVSKNRMVATELACDVSPTYVGGAQVVEIWPASVDFCEPVIDRSRWAKEEVLSMLIQQADQPSGDNMPEPKINEVWLVDVKLS
jgi:hypothetical protein